MRRHLAKDRMMLNAVTRVKVKDYVEQASETDNIHAGYPIP